MTGTGANWLADAENRRTPSCTSSIESAYALISAKRYTLHIALKLKIVWL